MSSLYAYLQKNKDRPINKMLHYIAAYERHFGRYVGQPMTFLEIGAGNGGSSQMFKHWFGPMARIVTIDINPICEQFRDEQVAVRLGDQSDPIFLQSLIDEFGPFDAVLDDGSHISGHVIASFNYLYPRIARNGVYMIEDVHTAYWDEFGGGYRKPGTIVEFFKDIIDRLNADHVRDNEFKHNEISRSTAIVSAWDSVLVFEKTPYINKLVTMIGDERLRLNY